MKYNSNLVLPFREEHITTPKEYVSYRSEELINLLGGKLPKSLEDLPVLETLAESLGHRCKFFKARYEYGVCTGYYLPRLLKLTPPEEENETIALVWADGLTRLVIPIDTTLDEDGHLWSSHACLLQGDEEHYLDVTIEIRDDAWISFQFGEGIGEVSVKHPDAEKHWDEILDGQNWDKLLDLTKPAKYDPYKVTGEYSPMPLINKLLKPYTEAGVDCFPFPIKLYHRVVNVAEKLELSFDIIECEIKTGVPVWHDYKGVWIPGGEVKRLLVSKNTFGGNPSEIQKAVKRLGVVDYSKVDNEIAAAKNAAKEKALAILFTEANKNDPAFIPKYVVIPAAPFARTSIGLDPNTVAGMEMFAQGYRRTPKQITEEDALVTLDAVVKEFKPAPIAAASKDAYLDDIPF